MKERMLFVLLIAVLLVSCSKDNDNSEPVVNDYLVSATFKSELPKEFLQLAIMQAGYTQYLNLPQGTVNAYAVTYKTQYPKGTPIAASGVFFVPTNINTSMPTVVYTHGTITKEEAPSVAIVSVEIFFSALIASTFGCVVLMPDYIGYGASANIEHPYIHKESLAQAGVDLVYAFKEYAEGAKLSFNPSVFITGYSEGGYAAVALQERIQEKIQEPTSSLALRVEKTVAGSGPYDNVALTKGLVTKNEECSAHEVSSYLWALSMLKSDYGYSRGYSDIFTADNDTKLRGIGYQMGYFIPENTVKIDTNPARLFKPEFIAGIQNDTDTEMLVVLEQNSLVSFSPADSLIFIYGGADTWVYPINTLNAYNAMQAKGCMVKKYEQPGGTHATTIDLYLEVLLNSLREVAARK